MVTLPLGFYSSITATADVSLGLPGSLSQGSSIPSLGILQVSLYLWYPLTTLDTVNACTIILIAPPFCSARDDKISDYEF